MRIRIKRKKIKQFVEKMKQKEMAANPFAFAASIEFFLCNGNIDKELSVVNKWSKWANNQSKRIIGVFA